MSIGWIRSNSWTRIAGLSVLALAAVLSSKTAAGQFVPLSRCRAAVPCNIPFLVLSKPEPLIAAHYGGTPTSALSLRIPLTSPLRPQIDTSRAIDNRDVRNDRDLRVPSTNTFYAQHLGGNLAT